MNTYDSMKIISKDKFIEFCRSLYWKAHSDGRRMVDEEPWIENKMADYNFNDVIEILWKDAER